MKPMETDLGPQTGKSMDGIQDDAKEKRMRNIQRGYSFMHVKVEIYRVPCPSYLKIEIFEDIAFESNGEIKLSTTARYRTNAGPHLMLMKLQSEMTEKRADLLSAENQQMMRAEIDEYYKYAILFQRL
jgi:hypothetical protein